MVFHGTRTAALASMLHKTSFLLTAAMNLLFVGLIAKLMQSLNKHAPVGYQDATGFHFGVRKS
jgi:hypothetical protein